MGIGSQRRDAGVDRRFVRGRRMLFCKQKVGRCLPLKPPVTDFLESGEIVESFKKCAYPNAVEILRLSEELDVSRSKIKIEFQKRRQAYRQRKKQSEDTLVHSCWQPRLDAIVTSLHKVNSLYQGVLKSTIVGFSLISLWYSEYLMMEGCNYIELLT